MLQQQQQEQPLIMDGKQAARTLRDYIYRRGHLFYFLNAANDYGTFVMEYPVVKSTIDFFGGLKIFCQRFPEYLLWTEINQSPGKGVIAVIQSTEDALGTFPIIVRERDRKVLDLNYVRVEDRCNFKQVYNFLAKHTVKLSGLPSTCFVNYYTIRDALEQLLFKHPQEKIRRAAVDTNIEVYVLRNPSYAEALVYFSIVMVDDFFGLTTEMFQYLWACIEMNQLSVAGYTLRVGNRWNLAANPWAPHFEAVALIPEILRSGSALGLSYRYSDLIQSPLPASPEYKFQQNIPTFPSLLGPAPVPLVQVQFIDSSRAVPTTVGELPQGLKSPVITDMSKLGDFKTILNDKFINLINTIEDPEKSLSIEKREEGIFVFKKHENFLLGKGSEAKVYLGGHIEQALSDTSIAAIRTKFRTMAKAVAVKQYFTGDGSLLEIATFRKMARNSDGIINYIDHFHLDDENYVVQELGLTTVHHLENRLSFEEKMKVIRAAILSMRELHTRSNGAIVHRDFRAPNVIITDKGTLKICDFGISRVLPETVGSIALGASAVKMLNSQPYEVQNAVNQILEKQERKGGQSQNGSLPSIPVSVKGDIFMLGLFIYRIITGEDVLSNSDIQGQRMPDLSAVEKCCVSGPLLVHLLSSMLSHDRANRPTIDDVLHHPFFCSWEENRNTVDALYRELHNGGHPILNESFQLLIDILAPLERRSDWAACLKQIPPTLRTNIVGSNRAPQLLLNADGSMQSDHPLPNLHLCVQWIRHFYTHVLDPPIFSACYPELKAGTNGNEAVAGFIYYHKSVNWLLLGVWEMRLKHLQKIEDERIANRERFEEACRIFEQAKRDLDTKERKSKAVLGQHNS